MEKQAKEKEKTGAGGWIKPLLIGGGVVLTGVGGGILAYKNRHKIKRAFYDFMGYDAWRAEDRHERTGFFARKEAKYSQRDGPEGQAARDAAGRAWEKRFEERRQAQAQAAFEAEIRSAKIVDGFIDHPRIIPQPESWGYDLIPGDDYTRLLSAVNLIAVHHSEFADIYPSIRTVNNWWRRRRRNPDTGKWENWDRAGYHFLILGDGRIWQLVPIHAWAWGAFGVNSRAIHIAFAGSFSPINLPSQAARDSFRFLCRALLANNALSYLHDPINHIKGHREVADDERRRPACPGFTRDQYLSWL